MVIVMWATLKLYVFITLILLILIQEILCKMAHYCALILLISPSSGNNQLNIYQPIYDCRILLYNVLHKMGQSCFISVTQLHPSTWLQSSFITFMTQEIMLDWCFSWGQREGDTEWIKSLFGCFTLTSCCSYLIYSREKHTSDINMNLQCCR